MTEKLKSNNGGRDFFLKSISGTCCTDAGPGLPQYEIVFGSANSPGGCVAAGSSGVVIHACTGGLGTVWGLQYNSNNHMEFINREGSGTILPLLEGLNNGRVLPSRGQRQVSPAWAGEYVPVQPGQDEPATAAADDFQW